MNEPAAEYRRGLPVRVGGKGVLRGADQFDHARVTSPVQTYLDLSGQEGKLFHPLAFTKTFAIGSSVVLAVTVVPFLCYLLFRPVKWRNRVAVALGVR